MALDIEFSDGRVGARAETGAAVATPSSPPSKPRGRPAGGSGQGDLF
jgi:hypothetical protein